MPTERKFTVKKDGKYYSHEGYKQVWVPGIAGCYTYPLDKAYALADQVGGEVVEVLKGDGGMFSFKEGPAPARESKAAAVVRSLLNS